MLNDEIFAGDIVKLEAIWVDKYWLVTVAGLLEERRVILDESGGTHVLEQLIVTVLEKTSVPWEPGMVLRARLDPVDFDGLQAMNDGEVPWQLSGDFLLVPGSRINRWTTVPQEIHGDAYEFDLSELAEFEVVTFCAFLQTALTTKGVYAALGALKNGDPAGETMQAIADLQKSTYRKGPASGESLLGTEPARWPSTNES